MKGTEQGGQHTPLLIQQAHLTPNPTTTWLHPSGVPHFTFPIPLAQVLIRKKSTTPFRTPLPTPTHMGGKEEHSTPRVQEKNRERKKRLVWSSASWSGFPRGLRCRHPPPVPSAFPRRATVLLCFQLTSTEVPGGCEEVWVGRSRGSGIEVPKAPTPGGGEGADSFVLFALLLDMPCHLSVPLLLSCHRDVLRLGSRRLQLYA